MCIFREGVTYHPILRLEIWTDVNGMFTADPRFVSAARLIRSLTYREAQVSCLVRL